MTCFLPVVTRMEPYLQVQRPAIVDSHLTLMTAGGHVGPQASPVHLSAEGWSGLRFL